MKAYKIIGAITLSVCAVLATAGAKAASTQAAKISTRLRAELQRVSMTAATANPSSSNPYVARFDAKGRIQVDISHPCGEPVDNAGLAAAGFKLSDAVSAPPYCVDEGWVSPGAVGTVASLGNVTLVDLPVYARTIPMPSQHTGVSGGVITNSTSSPIDGNAITIMHAAQYISQTGSNGSGVTVGVISDDITNIATIQGQNELPATVTDYTNYTSWGHNPSPTDEGTMMLEEVYAVAPGASLAFCGPETATEYVTCMQSMAQHHVNLVADDLTFLFQDLMSTDSTFAQGVATVLADYHDTTLFSASGNDAQSYWQGTYTPVDASNAPGGSATLTCNGQTDSYVQEFGSGIYAESLTMSASSYMYMQWADSYTSSTSKFDVYILDSSYNILDCASWSDTSPDAYDVLTSVSTSAAYLVIATPDMTAQGKFMKLDLYADGGATMASTADGAIDSPQKFISGVQNIGAVKATDGVGDTIEPYSGTGPIQLEYPSATTSQAPIFVAPDGVVVDTAGTDFSSAPTNANGDSVFYGTSAATPNAAAVAALLESTFPGVAPTAILTYMRDGATQLGTTVPDGTYGYGRVDAIGALNAVTTPAISATNSTLQITGYHSGSLSFTLTGAGTLSLSGSSDNGSLVTYGTNTAISPLDCGQSGVYSCSLRVVPAASQNGTANLTMTVTDGAGRTNSTTFIVDVSGNTGPSSGGGGAVNPDSLLLLALLALLVRQTAYRRRSCHESGRFR